MPGSKYRMVTHEDGDRRVIAIIERTPDNEQKTDAEIVARLDQWTREQRHRGLVDDEEQ
ncbi:hypothetical protein MQE23_08585 [Streptomyces sp. HP-A2021]|uniref:hypothetical protein n=1 Tax=Streptomyces sp. HP-A2021 TaxID=2927875 RepID=UPI001FB02000|nr:hypothetical protein [Streptomyces sp. HP-A2021]UOB09108.1 hypothetical protein MQE23_08585 [Streptomyces sp. HP-A2021]